MRVYIFEEDSSTLSLLILYLRNKGFQVQGFQGRYNCPLYLLEECACPANSPCTDAIIVNTRKPDLANIHFLIDQQEKGCRVSNLNKAVMSTRFSKHQEQAIRAHGFHIIEKPFSLLNIVAWLNQCSSRL